ncbi:flagellar motor switch phosphatase FliY [Tumebacillus sp. ITR2]|uniref:Flagellar motor switch phosphatase FliY n=1 Tax=Tumebacillus amylolyticus TaxID=2801339 RepID=A0ABS1JF64_9BACL|nr:flagellar motor switch phosphatase FliY [Tumebacillus amylolyticus]MBL0388921.1 flagellar motor switch phosphatase FliY [Tumebacillus amylolyticus]
MNKDVLSQQEIDALLRQNGDDDGTDPNSDDIRLSDYLSDFETDALGEIGNISFGTAATALSTLLRQKVDITTPKVSAVLRSSLSNDFPLPHVAIKVEYTDGFIGANVLAIRVEDAQIIADLMMGGDGTTAPSELNELHLSAVAEAMNQMMGSASTSMSTIFNMMVNITPPIVDVMDFDNKQSASLFPDDEVLIKISFRLIIGTLIDSHIMQLVPVSFAKDMISKLTGGMGDSAEPEPAPTPAQAMPEPTPVATAAPVQPMAQPSQPVAQPMYEAPVAAAGAPGHYPPPQQQYPPQPMYAEQQPPAGYPPYPPQQYPPQYAYPPYPQPYPPQGYPGYGDPAAQATGNQPRPIQQNVNVQPAQFSSFDASDITGGQGNLDLLLDIPLSITVELGRTKKLIRDILELVPGSIVQLDKLAGDPVDIMVNNKLVAKGEVVVIDENFGVRVTDIISPAERVRKLQ